MVEIAGDVIEGILEGRLLCDEPEQVRARVVQLLGRQAKMVGPCLLCDEPAESDAGGISIVCQRCTVERRGVDAPALRLVVNRPEHHRSRLWIAAIAACLALATFVGWLGSRWGGEGPDVAQALETVSASVEELRSLARNVEHPKALLAFDHLRLLGDRDVVPIAREYVRSERVAVSGRGFDALGDLGAPVPRKDAERALQSPRERSRIRALYALAASGDSQALQALADCVQSNRDLDVLVAATRRLMKIDRLEYQPLALEAIDGIEDEGARAYARSQLRETLWNPE